MKLENLIEKYSTPFWGRQINKRSIMETNTMSLIPEKVPIMPQVNTTIGCVTWTWTKILALIWGLRPASYPMGVNLGTAAYHACATSTGQRKRCCWSGPFSVAMYSASGSTLTIIYLMHELLDEIRRNILNDRPY